MKLDELMVELEKKYPTEAALSFDNVGLLVGRKKKEIHRVYLALDVTEAIVEAAIAEEADLILSHHPLWFSPANRLTD